MRTGVVGVINIIIAATCSFNILHSVARIMLCWIAFNITKKNTKGPIAFDG